LQFLLLFLSSLLGSYFPVWQGHFYSVTSL
jgi:hypothetical protein